MRRDAFVAQAPARARRGIQLISSQACCAHRELSMSVVDRILRRSLIRQGRHRLGEKSDIVRAMWLSIVTPTYSRPEKRNDTVLFERLFLTAVAGLARIRTVFADKGYDAEGLRRRAPPAQAGPAARLGPRPAALAGRAQPRVAVGEQAFGPALRQARLRNPIAAPGRLPLPGCRALGARNCDNCLYARPASSRTSAARRRAIRRPVQ
jgi:hypothetical protein